MIMMMIVVEVVMRRGSGYLILRGQFREEFSSGHCVCYLSQYVVLMYAANTFFFLQMDDRSGRWRRRSSERRVKE